MSRGLLVLGVTLVFSSLGCSSIFRGDRSVILAVPEVTAPTTIAPGTPLTVALTVQSGGCRRFDHIETSKNESGATLIAWGRDSGGENALCTTDIRHDRVSVTFNPPFASTFRITVNQGDILPPVILTVRVE
jgi:hypothetical protein